MMSEGGLCTSALGLGYGWGAVGVKSVAFEASYWGGEEMGPALKAAKPLPQGQSQTPV